MKRELVFDSVEAPITVEVDERLLAEVLVGDHKLEPIVRRLVTGKPIGDLICPSPRDARGATLLQDTRDFGRAGIIAQNYFQRFLAKHAPGV